MGLCKQETEMNPKKVIRVVWDNHLDKRYIPRGYDGDFYSWGVWDQIEGKYVDDQLNKIDPNEPMLKN